MGTALFDFDFLAVTSDEECSRLTEVLMPTLDALENNEMAWTLASSLNEAFLDSRSPIERLFVCGLYRMKEVLDCTYIVQVGISRGPYTVDVVLGDYIGGGDFMEYVELGIELDGQKFHAVSSDQWQRDRQRDRQLLREHFLPIVRFTGSEVYRDPFSCAEEAIKIANAYFTKLANGWRAG